MNMSNRITEIYFTSCVKKQEKLAQLLLAILRCGPENNSLKTCSALEFDLSYTHGMVYQSENIESCGRFLSSIGQKRVTFDRSQILHS